MTNLIVVVKDQPSHEYKDVANSFESNGNLVIVTNGYQGEQIVNMSEALFVYAKEAEDKGK